MTEIISRPFFNGEFYEVMQLRTELDINSFSIEIPYKVMQ